MRAFNASVGMSPMAYGHAGAAVSLHAPDDELRDELVPVDRRGKVAEVTRAAVGYMAATGRRVCTLVGTSSARLAQAGHEQGARFEGTASCGQAARATDRHARRARRPDHEDASQAGAS